MSFVQLHLCPLKDLYGNLTVGRVRSTLTAPTVDESFDFELFGMKMIGMAENEDVII
jgi:hypothetical protein